MDHDFVEEVKFICYVSGNQHTVKKCILPSGIKIINLMLYPINITGDIISCQDKPLVTYLDRCWDVIDKENCNSECVNAAHISWRVY